MNVTQKVKVKMGNAQEKSMQKPLKLDFKKISKIKGFQEEFLDKFEEYSLSWREQILREKRF